MGPGTASPGLASVLVAVLLGACAGQEEDAVATRVAPGGDRTAGAEQSLGVDTVTWPGDLAGADALLRALPETVGGESTDVPVPPPEEQVTSVAASFGERGLVRVVDGSSTGSAYGDLAAGFALMFGCERGTYAGTAPGPHEVYGGPDVTAEPPPAPVWFSCTTAGAEGDSDFTGRVVGWTSNGTGWTVVGEDDEMAEAIVVALRDAAP